jgi:UDP-N-acetylglucosamine:LPS N-acetylglucosamine transferase
LCGRNEELRQRLERKPSTERRQVALGYTEQMASVLHLGDYFIGKPGPGSLSEALHCGLPVLSFDGPSVMPQERYNAQWLREEGLGVLIRSVAEIRDGLDLLLAELPQFRQRVARLDNRAVFEVPDILERILQEAARPVGQPQLAGLVLPKASPVRQPLPLSDRLQVKRP